MRLRTPGARPPIMALVILAAMVGVYLTTTIPPQVSAAEILRDGPSPTAPYRKPELEDLLSGRACIPLSVLLANRPQDPIHSYSTPVNCERGPQ